MVWFLRHLGAPIEMSEDCVLLLSQFSTNCGAWDQENWSSGGFAPILWLCRRQGGSFVSMRENSFFQATRLLHCLARQLIVQLIVLQKRLEGDLIVGTRTVAINIFSLLQPLFGRISTFCGSHVIFHFNQHFLVIFLKRLMISGFICDTWHISYVGVIGFSPNIAILWALMPMLISILTTWVRVKTWFSETFLFIPILMPGLLTSMPFF